MVIERSANLIETAASFAAGLPWLTIIGIGEDGWDGLTGDTQQTIVSAGIIYGAERHLALLPAGNNQRIAWPSPMMPAVHEMLATYRGRAPIAVLASGDPMLYGIGATLANLLPNNEYRIIPQVSSFSLTCARMGWAAVQTTLVSMVHRPTEQLYRYLYPGQNIVIFSEDASTPQTVSRMLTVRGFGPSRMSVFSSLGGPAEHRIDGTADDWTGTSCADLNLIALTCVAAPHAQLLSLVPGLPEDNYETDGQLTKREVRAATLARLAPMPGQRLWDVGAGTGTIGIEWMRAHPSCSCTAFEEREDRAANIRANANLLGVPALKVVTGSAPHTFVGQEQPDTVFIGGGIATEGLFEQCWNRLPQRGLMVVNAVTLDTEARLLALHKLYGGELTRISVARAEAIGPVMGWRQLTPVTQWATVKP